MRALLMAASGARAAYAVGAARVLIRDHGLRYGAIAGVGMCGTSACVLAQGEQSIQAAELAAAWGSIREVAPESGPFGPVEMTRGYFIGPGSWVPLFEGIRTEKVAESETAVLVGGWAHKEACFFQWPGTSPDLWDAVKLASGVIASRPELVREHIGKSPMQTLVMMGATKIDIILATPEKPLPEPSSRVDAFSVAFNHADVELCAFMDGDIGVFRASARTRILRPKDWAASMVDPLVTDPFSVRASLEKGAQDAQEVFGCR